MEPDRGHPQLGRGESGCLQQMGWGCLRSPRNEGPYLDPLNLQTKYSAVLLNLFRFLLQLPDYVQRLQRHYPMFRDSVEPSDRGQPGNLPPGKQAEAPPRPQAWLPVALSSIGGSAPH